MRKLVLIPLLFLMACSTTTFYKNPESVFFKHIPSDVESISFDSSYYKWYYDISMCRLYYPVEEFSFGESKNSEFSLDNCMIIQRKNEEFGNFGNFKKNKEYFIVGKLNDGLAGPEIYYISDTKKISNGMPVFKISSTLRDKYFFSKIKTKQILQKQAEKKKNDLNKAKSLNHEMKKNGENDFFDDISAKKEKNRDLIF